MFDKPYCKPDVLQVLPEPIGRITIPTTFSVSALSVHGGCRLKLAATSKEWRPLYLPSGPDAAIGTFVHSVLARAGESNEPVESIFEFELNAARESLSGDPLRAHFADLKKTRSFMEWRNIRAGVLAKLLGLRAAHSSNPASLSASAPSRGARFTGTEIRLGDETLRISGRSDRIERIGSRNYLIRDFKTGRFLDADGKLLPSIRIQLQLYALLAEARYPSCEISLKVESGTESFDIPWNSYERSKIREELAAILKEMPTGADEHAESLAKPGDECCFCALRHRCTAYMKVAPSWWNQIPAHMGAIASDTWGKIEATEKSGSLVNVTLTDSVGRLVKVRGMRRREGFDSVRAKEMIYIFSLERTGSGRGWNGRPFHPHAFHEIGADAQARTAWTTTVYCGRAG